MGIFLSKNSVTSNDKLYQKVHKILNDGSSSFDEADMFILIGYDCSDENVIGDTWTLNSCGGNGDGHTKFNAFFEKFSFILQSNSFTK